MGGAAEEADRALAELWWRELDPQRTECEDEGFVSLGGYSMAAIRFAAAVQERFGVRVPFALLLRENATLADIRALVRGAEPEPVAPAAPGSLRRESALAPSQRRLWLVSTLHPEAAAYNVVAALGLRGALSVEALAAALADVVARHDALRAHLVPGNGDEPRLRYAADVAPELVQAVAAGPLTEQARAEFIQEIALRPLPLAEPPLLRAGLLRAGRGEPESVLVISIHHAVSDQRSADLVLADLAAAYAARLAGRDPGLPAAPSFAAHAEEQAAAVDGPRWRQDLDYWRAHLADPPPASAPPFRLAAPPLPSLRGAEHDAVFGAELSGLLEEYVRARGVSPAMVLLSCVGLVLGGWSGSERVIVGMPSSRRRESGEQDLVGFLIETLPILVDTGAATDFAALLGQVRDTYVDAVTHSTPTFDAIVAALELPPRPLASPLFTAWFNDLTQGSPPPSLPGLAVEAVPTPGFAALFELNFYLHRGPDGYRLQLVRALDRVRAEVAAELLAQVLLVLRQVLAEDRTPLPELSLRTVPAEQDALPAPAPLPLITGAAGAASAIALRTPAGELSYAGLEQAVAALAAELTAAGVLPGAVVEVRARRAGGTAVAFLALRRLGAVAALVDPALPAARLAEHRKSLRPVCAVLVDPVAVAGVRIEALDARPRMLPGASHILMTSGSGGRPVAVVAPAGALENALHWYAGEFAPTAADRVALLAGLGHDPLLRDLLVPLRHGGTLVVPPPEVLGEPLGLLDFLHSAGITLLHATPALLELLLAAAAGNRRLPELRLVLCGGAPLTAGLVRRLREITPAAVVNAYGATETPQIAARHLVLGHGEPAEQALAGWPPEAVLPLGSGVAGADLLVRTAAGTPAGVGQLGHILVRGAGLADYLEPDPTGRFQPETGAAQGIRTFATGDLGRLGPDGLVHFAGRADRQLTLDGFRVAPEEVEAAARALPSVAQAAAGLLDTPAGPTFALQVVAAPGTHLTAEAVRAHLLTRLPGYAVPSAVTVVAELSRSRNHKVLLDPVATPAPAPAPPGADLGGWLGELFRQVLGHEIPPEQSFFEAGLTSMSLVRLHAHLATVLPDPPPATALFAHPTLRALARYLATRDSGAAPRPRGRAVDPERLRQEAQRRREIRRGRSRN